MITLRYKILLVEDAEIAQEAASVVLQSIGCQVDVVKTGNEAVEQIAKENYDLIFMDLGLPDIDGFTTTETIRKAEMNAHPSSRPIPIIALTTHEGSHVELTCLDTKMDGFVVKPLTLETAKNLLEEHVKKTH
jgi:CheY-like chemotaxis protein